jgi:hypothetical protein
MHYFEKSSALALLVGPHNSLMDSLKLRHIVKVLVVYQLYHLAAKVSIKHAIVQYPP